MYYDRKTLDKKHQKMKTTSNTDILSQKTFYDTEMIKTELKIQHAFNFTFIGLLMLIISNACEIPQYSLITTGIGLAGLIVITLSLIAIRRLITRIAILSNAVVFLHHMEMAILEFKPICTTGKPKEPQEKAAE